MNAEQYTYRVFWSEEDQEYVGLCLEFPSLSWLDPVQSEAFNGIVELTKQCIADLLASGEPVPEAFSLRQYSGKFMVRVLPEVHRELVIQAAEQAVSLNRLVSSKLSR